MGVPITSYSVLRKLDIGDKNDHETQQIREYLKQFGLIAFILHDPVANVEFDRSLNDLFDRLDYLTGPRLLFFALIKPSARIPDEILRRRMTGWLDDEDSNLTRDHAHEIILLDDRIFLYNLCLSLEIPYDALPVIVISNHFDARKIFWVQTGTEHLRKQFEDLGHFAVRVDLSAKSWKEAQYLIARQIQRVNPYTNNGSAFLEESLVKTITQILSFRVRLDKTNELSWDAERKSLDALRKLDNKLRRSPNLFEYQQDFDLSENISSYPDIRNEPSMVEDLIYDLSGTLAGESLGYPDPVDPSKTNRLIEERIKWQLKKGALEGTQLGSRSIDLERFDIPFEFLDPESQIQLDIAYRLYGYYIENQISGLNDDWSSPMLPLALLFEHEINLSIVHWLRESFGIIMPQFYNRHQPRVSAIYESLDLNKQIKNRWHPPALGQSEYCFNKYLSGSIPGKRSWKESNNGGFTLSDTSYMTSRWGKIRIIRNQCAHPGILNQYRAIELKELLEKLNEIRFYQKIFKLKSRLKGEQL